MIRFVYPDGTYCFRPLHTVHAIFHADGGTLTARAEKPDQSGMKEFEIAEFELLETGKIYR